MNRLSPAVMCLLIFSYQKTYFGFSTKITKLPLIRIPMARNPIAIVIMKLDRIMYRYYSIETTIQIAPVLKLSKFCGSKHRLNPDLKFSLGVNLQSYREKYCMQNLYDPICGLGFGDCAGSYH